MARTGDVHTQPGGYRLSFTVTGAASGGGLLEMDVTYPAHSRSPAPHSMHAAADGPTRFVWQVRPALATAAMFEKVWQLAAEGKTNDRGAPNLLQGAVLMQAYAREFRLVRPPWWLQVPIFALLAPIGRALGYRAH